MTMNRGTYVDTLYRAQRRNQKSLISDEHNAFRLEKMTITPKIAFDEGNI